MITFNRLGRFGNIGNSLFQYSTLLGVGNKTGYNIQIPKHSTYYSADYENYNFSIFDGFNIDEPILDFNFNEIEHTFEYTGMGFREDIFEIKDNTNLHGYFQCERYFNFCRDLIIGKLKFKNNIVLSGCNLFTKLNIVPEETTSVHVRRGDFLKKTQFHVVQPPEYFIKAINLIPSKNYLFFSDDIDWCKRVFGNNNQVYFSEEQNPFVDLYAMSRCMNNIIVNSSFSWWGAWLNTNIKKQVIAPKNWFGPAYNNQPPTDIVTESWRLI
jgi:hypothetical protein